MNESWVPKEFGGHRDPQTSARSARGITTTGSCSNSARLRAGNPRKSAERPQQAAAISCVTSSAQPLAGILSSSGLRSATHRFGVTNGSEASAP